MRFAKLFPLVLAGLPLGAQQGPPLAVSLDYSGTGQPAFRVSRPAYVAIFSVTSTSIRQLYPSTRTQNPEVEGHGSSLASYSGYGWPPYLFSSDWSYAMSSAALFAPFSSFGSAGGYDYGLGGFPFTYSGFGGSGLHTVVVVASTSPLRIDSPGSSEYRIRRTLESRGRYRNFDTDEGLDAILGVIASDDPRAEQVSTFEEYQLPMQVASYRPLDFRGLMLDCENSWVFNASHYGNSGYCRPTLSADSAIWPHIRPSADTTATKVDSAGQARRAAALREGKISDPAAIRRVLEGLQGAAPARTGARYGSPEAPTLPVDARSRTQVGSAAVKTEGESVGSARTKGPVSNSTAGVPAPPAPRQLAPAPSPPPAAAAPVPVKPPAN